MPKLYLIRPIFKKNLDENTEKQFPTGVEDLTVIRIK
jgi:hypothetical protein